MKDQLIGTWLLVSVVAERDDGTRSEPFGANPKGIIIFTADGHFSLLQSRAEIPKIAAGDRARATADEAMAIVGGVIAYYGTYTVNEAERTITPKPIGSTLANMLGMEQKRIVTLLTADELRFTNPRTPAGDTLLTVWTRALAQ